MDVKRLRVSTCPTDRHSHLNRVIINPKVFPNARHLEITNQYSKKFIFTITPVDGYNPEEIGFNAPMRKWAELMRDSYVEVRPFNFDMRSQCISLITLEIDILMKNAVSSDVYDTDDMAISFSQQFADQSFTVGQQLAFKYADKKLLQVVVKEIQVLDVASIAGGSEKSVQKVKIGVLSANSTIIFVEGPDSGIKLKGKSKAGSSQQSLISPNWDFETLGIGGLDKEFNDIFRRAFASKVIPLELVEQLGLTHVKGILLYGPPGTGKTLIARQIGSMLNARPPKVVNGPSILDKYVGESESNIRKLFAEAEAEYAKVGNRSGLHIIIFDEIDAICKQRGSVAGGAGVHDSVVNQLLTKIDGVDSLNNILVIGMTNRKDLIDEALLRPGRFEVQIEISLPDEKGREQILKIHTKKMKENGRLADDVDIQELAAKTKNFSGAELEGLVRAAQSAAMTRIIRPKSKVEIDSEALNKLIVCRSDFLHALEHDVKPAFGASSEEIEGFFERGIINWCPQIEALLEEGDLVIGMASNPRTRRVVPIFLEGSSGAGKSALAATIAKMSNFPFMKLCSPEQMIGCSESAKCSMIRKIFDDAYKSHLSCVIVDQIEELIDFTPIGPRFSNLVLRALKVLINKQPPKGRFMLVLCTTSMIGVLKELNLTTDSSIINVPEMTEVEHLLFVIQKLSEASGIQIFNKQDYHYLEKKLRQCRIKVGIKRFIQIYDSYDNEKDYDPGDRAHRFFQSLQSKGCVIPM
ncbi:vesicle-fusing ATPase 1-like [Panonychus citri]|uniref:vesicle-fusing ATPase 1-like n=1 Tax=Panonychus citri TaxID=50023 RepID=UPI002306F20E|nr:vesicle-fusing ATPase 1-like [Panonychus citri]